MASIIFRLSGNQHVFLFIKNPELFSETFGHHHWFALALLVFEKSKMEKATLHCIDLPASFFFE